MKDVIEDLRKKLEKGVFKNEEQVRIGIIARLCQKLGWDIWDPEVFNTEYTITVPDNSDNHHGTTRTYKVDIALCKRSSNIVEPHILIEVKGVNMNQQQEISGRNQLEIYSSKFDSISILTDGRNWEFYLNSLKKINTPYESCMISKLNLSKDNIDEICDVFHKLMNPNETKNKLDKIGRIMRRTFVIEQYIYEALPIAKLKKHDITMISQDVFSIIKTEHKLDKILQPEFQKVWSDMLDKGKIEIGKIEIGEIDISKPPLKELPLHIKVKDITAYCIYDYKKKKYFVKAGSEVRSSITDYMKKERDRSITDGELKYDKETRKYRLTRDKEFKTPSGAACFVLGRNSNGWEEWLDEKDLPLKNYKQSLGN
ncbi:MAG: DUF4357 domain-containing protein [Candidatus Cloacimonas acidaminovorans]|jgi:predicted type IV restriction endonuclease|nr:DUF4357 domain-containing protein [Methanofastidiosum sp.]MDY0218563.1 DUF4357 domain-containing protein [Candidatus Cloacimonas acidaminovorans]HNQ40302.1 DUF4357 domain-containing protein [Candidatus Cloacimonas sp.]HPH72372.1 DUF4357 domain-containing protein [Candidatus Cloacimonas sp.]HQM17612.1 DUF4357 domain-containing protein [Candidatus Cloacimonas sp.]